MIGYLQGKPLVQNQTLLVITHGVGYQVNVSPRILNQAAALEEVTLYVYTHVREEQLELYGFLQPAEKDMFQLLLSVSGVGPRIALAIAEYGPEKISDAVQTANVTVFSSVPRVGKKLAQKIIIELKSKLGSLYELQLGPQNRQQQDVIEALQALGFAESEIHQALPQLNQVEQQDTPAIIKAAIKLLTRTTT